MKVFQLFSITIIIGINAVAQKADWKPLGPRMVPVNVAAGGAIGLGRTTCLRFHPYYDGDTNKTMFLGTADGGVWKSSSGGNDWENLNTDKLPVLGISDIAIDPKNPLNMFIASGDPDALFNSGATCLGNEAFASRGIFKSSDGGITWSNVPLGNWYNEQDSLMKDFWKYPTHKLMPKLKMNPEDPRIMIAVVCTNRFTGDSYDSYVYKTSDGGQNWYIVLSVPNGYLRDLELMPGNPSVIYVSGRNIFKSSNGGKKWKMISSFTDSLKDIKRIEMSVTDAEPKYLYANVSPRKFIYRSEDGGKTFKPVMKNIDNGADNRVAMAVSNVNKDLVFVNNGIFVNFFFVRESGKKQLNNLIKGTHADIHDLTFAPDSNTVFVSCDGGIYKAIPVDSIKWTSVDISNGLDIVKVNRIGVSQHSDKLIIGVQDAGTLLYDTARYPPYGWATISGGDGGESIIDYTSDSILYRSDGQGYSSLSRSDNYGKTWSGNLLPRDSLGGGIAKSFFISEQNHNTLYFAFHDIIKNNNKGNGTWEKISKFKTDFPDKPNEFITDFAVAPSDSKIIYCAFPNPIWGDGDKEAFRLYKTTDGGITWKDISRGLTGIDWTTISRLTVDPHHPDTVFVGFAGCWIYKMMASFDGGNTWMNYSEGLPDECDILSIAMDKRKNNLSMYIGTFQGVYYRDTSTGGWVSFNDGFPNVVVNEVEINYFNKKIYAGTAGRGVWMSKLYD